MENILDVNSMSEQERKRYNKFKKFYNPVLLNFYNKTYELERGRNKETYVYKTYLDILKKIVKLSDELGIYNSFELIVLFEYLLLNGYLSKDRNLVYSVQGRINNMFLLGADVINGKSVCLNNSAMLSDVLNVFGTESYLLSCFVTGGIKRSDFEYVLDFGKKKTKCSEGLIKNSIFDIIMEKMAGNHAIVLFKEDGQYYLSDPTNFLFLNCTDFLRASFVGSNKEIDLTFWPLLVLNDLSYGDFYKIINDAYFSNYRDVLTIGDVKDFSESILTLCRDNYLLLDDFYCDIKSDIDTVCKILRKNKL